MALQLHVNGTAHIMSGTSGPEGFLEELGVSVDGVTITINNEFDDIFTDHYGPKAPYDKQYFLQTVMVKCNLIWYEKDVLYKWLAGGIPGPTQQGPIPEGFYGYAGDVITQNALTAQLVIRSTPEGTGLTVVEDCWNFPHAVLVESAEQKVGVEKTVWNLTWQAMPTQVASASFGALLWDHSCT